MTTVMDPDPATCSHLVGPETPNFAAWFEVLNVAGLVRLNKDRESGRGACCASRVTRSVLRARWS